MLCNWELGTAVARGGTTTWAGVSTRHLGQPKVEYLGVTALSNKNIRWLDVAMHDAFAMRGIERISNLNSERQCVFRLQWPPSDAMSP